MIFTATYTYEFRKALGPNPGNFKFELMSDGLRVAYLNSEANAVDIIESMHPDAEVENDS